MNLGRGRHASPQEGGTFSHLTLNLLPANCRLDVLEGKEYVVVPMVILTEGVHAGSAGPVYYPAEELAKVPEVWNHKPVVVYHPTFNGRGVSACDPVILNSRKVGLMLNTRFEKGRLKSEAWIDQNRADQVDERIMAAVNAKEMMELSTGLYIDIEEVEGDWNGEHYIGIARNFRPDHLALLPDQVGACSIADGAGFLRNSAMLQNELSHAAIYSDLEEALRKRFTPLPADTPAVYFGIVDVFDDSVVFTKDGELWRLRYTRKDDEGVSLSDEEPVKVTRVTEYREVENSAPRTNQRTNMNKLKIVKLLVENSVTSVDGVTLSAEMTEDDVKGLKDESLEAALAGLLKRPTQNAAPPPPPPAKSPEAPPPPAAQTKIVSLQDYISQAPKEIQEVLTNSMEVYNEEKKKLIETIKANKANTFTVEALETKPLSELRAIAALAAPTPTANYTGLAPVPTSNQVEEALEIPMISFAKK